MTNDMFKTAETKDGYSFPPIDLLEYHSDNSEGLSDEAEQEIRENTAVIIKTLSNMGFEAAVSSVTRGASVTRYVTDFFTEGESLARGRSINAQLSLDLGVCGVRHDVLRSKMTVAFEVPNKRRRSVSIRELVDSDEFHKPGRKLPIAVGKDIDGNIVIGDLAEMQHLLIGGMCGSGTAMFDHTFIMSIVFSRTPEDVRLILIDTKRVEFPCYRNLPHLLVPVITDPIKGAAALSWACGEAERRYSLFAESAVKDIDEYNEKVIGQNTAGKLPRVVIYIEEFADLMLENKDDVEERVGRLLELGKNAGIHLVIATQAPRKDVLTKKIRDDFPSRIAFEVFSNVDSRVLLGERGAEDLLGRCDMLYRPAGYERPIRIQAGFISTKEIRNITNHIKDKSSTVFDSDAVRKIETIYEQLNHSDDLAPVGNGTEPGSYDDLLKIAVTLILSSGNASTAYLQRSLHIAFPRAARLMDDIEDMGIIGSRDGTMPRSVNITLAEWCERLGLV